MCIFEYDEEKHLRSERKIWMAEGEARGEKRGETKGAKGIIELGQEFGMSESEILKRLQKKLSISRKEAQEYFEMFAKQVV